jgi:MFS family permease
MIFIGSYIGGKIQDKKGPRPVALAGGFIYAFGCVPTSFALLHKAASSPKNVRWQETFSEVDV